MNEIINGTYHRLVANMPISTLNMYYRRKTLHQSAYWASFPLFFIHTPKAAGTSICTALNMPDSSHLLFDEMRAEVRCKLTKKPCFMIVRDPVDRLISTYFYSLKLRRQKTRSLIEWVAHFKSPEQFLFEVANKPDVRKHYFLRPAYELYNSAVSHGAKIDIFDFNDVNQTIPLYLQSHGIDIGQIPKRNVSQRTPLRKECVSTEICRMIADKFLDDYSLLHSSRRIA